jgi:hypothetical protein
MNITASVWNTSKLVLKFAYEASLHWTSWEINLVGVSSALEYGLIKGAGI